MFTESELIAADIAASEAKNSEKMPVHFDPAAHREFQRMNLMEREHRFNSALDRAYERAYL